MLSDLLFLPPLLFDLALCEDIDDSSINAMSNRLDHDVSSQG